MGVLLGTSVGSNCGSTMLSTIMKLHLHCVGTILFGISIVLYCFFAFSITVIDSHNEDLYLNEHPPWPTLQSPLSVRRWRVLQSSSVRVIMQPVKTVVPVEKALQGMGTLFRKGTRPMRELIVAHLSEETSIASLGLFLRTLHRSGAMARADVVVLFPGGSMSSEVLAMFQKEEASFQKMLALSDPKKLKPTASGTSNSTIAPFNWMQFKRAEEEQHVRGYVIWGSRLNLNNSSSSESQADGGSSGGDNQTWAGYGSIAGFDMQDLDPHNVLSGFLDNPPAQLRRWVCYEMLLGMVRTKYRNVLVTQVNVIFVGDPLAAIRRRHHLYLSAEDRSWLDLEAEEFLESRSPNPTSSTGKRPKSLEVEEDENDTNSDVNLNSTSKVSMIKKKKGGEEVQVKGLIPSVYGNALWQSLDKAHREKVVVSSNFAMGRIEYVRKLANKMTTEVVRIALEKKTTRRPFHDKAVLNYLVHQSSVLGKRVLDHIKIVANKDSVVHSLVGSKQPHVFWKRRGRDSRYAIIQGFNTSDLDSRVRGCNIVAEIHSDICQSPAESQVYQDCLPGHAPGLYSW